MSDVDWTNGVVGLGEVEVGFVVGVVKTLGFVVDSLHLGVVATTELVDWISGVVNGLELEVSKIGVVGLSVAA